MSAKEVIFSDDARHQMAATQSIIKTQQSDLQPFYSEHTPASPGLESAVLRYHGRKFVLGLLKSCRGLTHYRGEESASFIKWQIETVDMCC